MQAAQMLLDGSEEALAQDSGGMINFMKVSQAESGLLLVNQAALVLDRSPSRVSQLVTAGKFRAWQFFGKTYLSAREIDARRTGEVKNGRPPRGLAKRLKLTGKLIASMDGKQWVASVID